MNNWSYIDIINWSCVIGNDHDWLFVLLVLALDAKCLWVLINLIGFMFEIDFVYWI